MTAARQIIIAAIGAAAALAALSLEPKRVTITGDDIQLIQRSAIAQTSTSRLMMTGASTAEAVPPSYIFAKMDDHKRVNISRGSAMLPKAQVLGAGWIAEACNKGPDKTTISPAVSTIAGAQSYSLLPSQCIVIASDGYNYYVVPGSL